jgi:lipopolysaccharide biosynthesis glycosyltransferase
MNEAEGYDGIRIVLAADDNYAMPLAVAMCSVAWNCDPSCSISFYIVQRNITGDLRRKVERSVIASGHPHLTFQWLEIPGEVQRIDDLDVCLDYTTSLTFARLLIPDLLPENIPRVIYLDSDVVVCDDISKLWAFDVSDYALLAVRDTMAFVSHPDGIVNYQELGIPGHAPYFNAGVMCINLDKWRSENISERTFAYLGAFRQTIRLADQEALNAVLWDDWGELEYRWNWQILHRFYRLGRGKAVWVPEASDQSLVHFTTGEKPWRPGCGYKEKDLFFEYLDRTEWKGWRIPRYLEARERIKAAVGDGRNTFGRVRRKLVSKLTGPWKTSERQRA